MFFKENVKQDNDAPVVDGVEINDMADYNNFLIESEESWGNLQVAAMAASHQAIIEDNQSLMEGVVRDYWERVKEFFQKLWAALKQFISNVWGRISALWMNKAKWVNKYKKAILVGAKKAEAKSVMVTYSTNSVITDISAAAAKAKELKNLAFEGKKDAVDALIANFKSVEVESVKLTEAVAKNAINDVELAIAVKKNLEIMFKNEEANIKAGYKLAEALASRDDSDKDKEESKKAIETYKKKAAGARKIKTAILSYTSRLLSMAFAVCKKAYSYGPSTKEAFKSGSATMGGAKVSEGASILEQFGYQG